MAYRVVRSTLRASARAAAGSGDAARGWRSVRAAGAFAAGAAGLSTAAAMDAGPPGAADGPGAAAGAAFAAAGAPDARLPEYRVAEVAAHSGGSSVWVTFRDGVYDVSEFVASHPGGPEKIMMAAGKAVDPFWEVYGVHKQDFVAGVLAPLRIGTIAAADRAAAAAARAAAAAAAPDAYAAEPRRSPLLVVQGAKPFNAEPPAALLDADFHTPAPLFYVRNHMPVPTSIDGERYRLRVGGGGGGGGAALTLAEIKALPKHTITAAIQCAGNRRSEMHALRAIKGGAWATGAISNATWSGARLVDVLAAAGAAVPAGGREGAHVVFGGLDADGTGVSYGASVPAAIALDPAREVLLAYEMNGEALPSDHGAPLRVVAGGVAGARQVKWLASVSISNEESTSHWQRRDYKGFAPGVDWDTVKWDSVPSIIDMPVQSAFCFPPPAAAASGGAAGGGASPVAPGDVVKAHGYAWAGGGRGIVRVDVTSDGGCTWHATTLKQAEKQSLTRMWAWTLWTCDVPVPATAAAGSELRLHVRAVDSAYNVQPERVDAIWNLRGVLNNAWHCVTVPVGPPKQG